MILSSDNTDTERDQARCDRRGPGGYCPAPLPPDAAPRPVAPPGAVLCYQHLL